MANDSKHRISVGGFSAQLTNLDLWMGLRVSKLNLEGQSLSIQKDPFSIEAGKPGSLVAIVTEGDLAAFLDKQSPAGMKNFRVRASEGKLYVDGSVKAVLIDVPAKAVCSLRIVNEQELWVDLESVDILGTGAKNLVQSQLDKINPVMDVRDLPVSARLERVEIGDGIVRLTGTISP